MHVAALWRYPVKSMAGERLDVAHLTADGVVGDRVVHVEDEDGDVISSRTRPALLAHRGTWVDGEVRVDGRPWRDPTVADDVRRAAGPAARLVAYAPRDGGDDERFPGPRFDRLPLLVATDGAIAAFGRDGRRLRPNIVVGGVDGLAERTWEGRTLRIGAVVVATRALRRRCVMTTYDPDTQAQDHEVLRDIVRRFAGTLALDADVIVPGVVRVGDEAVLA